MAAFNDEIAVIGVGTTPFGPLYRDRDAKRSAYTLATDAFAMALEDSTVDKGEIDGLIFARLPAYARMADLLGIRRPRLVHNLNGAGRMSGVALQTAAAAIRAGLADTVALIYGNQGRSAGATYGGGPERGPTDQYDLAYGMTSPGASVALMYERYTHLYGVPNGALAPLAINNRNNATLNPDAVMREPITEDQYLSARFVTEPLRLYDYCLINDGAVALIVTSRERAERLERPLVTLTASATRGDLGNFYASDDLNYESARRVADEVYGDAGITPDDVSGVQIYDNFTPVILFSLEGFGYAERGTAWEFVRDHELGPKGDLPLNTSGGHTSESYMQGWALHAEMVRQLRGEAGARQIPDAHTMQYMCLAPIVSSHIMRRS